MTLDLDAIEATARKAQEDSTANGWSWESCAVDYECQDSIVDYIKAITPDVVLALVARVRELEASVRYLWDEWSNAEGEGQPAIAVFGTDDDEAMRADGFRVVRPRPGVQAAIESVLGRRP